MKVSYLTDAQVREAYLKLLTRIDAKLYDEGSYTSSEAYYKFWNELGYSNGEIPDY